MKLISFIIIGMLFSNLVAFSELDCESDCELMSTPWTLAPAPVVITTYAPECKITIHYEWRRCDYQYEYRYTSIVADGNCEQMANFSKEHYNISSLMEMADMIIAEESDHLDGHATLAQLPHCGSGFLRKHKYYTVGCGVWVKCSYIIDQSSEIKKDRGYIGICEVADQDGYIHKWKWQSCGESCCKRRYDICRYSSPVTGFVEVRVTQHPAIQIGECTQQDNFGPWEITDPMNPAYNYECQHACNN